jgi:hypothetical protein
MSVLWLIKMKYYVMNNYKKFIMYFSLNNDNHSANFI